MSSSHAHTVHMPNEANGYLLTAPAAGVTSFNVVSDPESAGDEPSRAFSATAR